MWRRGERTTAGPLEIKHRHCSIKDREWLLVRFLPQNQEMKVIRLSSLNSEETFATPVLDQRQFPYSRLFCEKKSVKWSKQGDLEHT